jgi:hypothetical protein
MTLPPSRLSRSDWDSAWIADMLGIEPMNVALLVKQGMPHSRDDEGRVLFDPAAVDEWVAARDWNGFRWPR